MKTAPFPKSRFAAVNVSTVPRRSPLRYPGGKSIDYPQATDVTFKKAKRVRYDPAEK